MSVVVGIVGFGINALLLAWLARRLLGATVGWPRTIALSLVLWLTAQPVITYVSSLLDIPLAADDPDLAGPELASYSLVLLLLAAWILVLEIAVLTVLELLVPTGSLPTPLHLARTWPARVRRTRRLATILRVATRHGLGGYLRRRTRRDQTHEALAVSLREALTDGGATFVKLGQTLATRDDVVPAAYVRELGRLHSDVAPEPWERIEGRIAAELGRPPGEVFARLDPTPLAAASVGQVHTARLASGEEVVLKVQRTDAAAQTHADLDLVTALADRLEDRTDWGRRLGARGLADGFAASLRDELDYGVELENMSAVGAAASGPVRVPGVRRDLSTPRLLVMERVVGEPLSRAGDLLSQLDATTRAGLAQDLLGSVLRQILVHGVFHADLHPGNIVLTVPAEDAASPVTGRGGSRPSPATADPTAGAATPRGEERSAQTTREQASPSPTLTLLDFGSVGRLDRTGREALAHLLLAFDRQDALAAADALIELLGRPESLDDRAFERDLGTLLLATRSTDLARRLTHLAIDHGFSVPPMPAAAFRAIATLEGSLRVLDPDVDLLAAARAHGPAIMAEHLTPAGIRSRVESHAAVVLPLLQRLPRRLDRLTADLESGGVPVRIRGVSESADRGFVLSLVREASTALLGAALTLCGVLLLTFGDGPTMIGRVDTHGYVGATLLLFGFVLGARLLVAGFRRSAL